MELPSIDLNLLVALHALLQERNVTRAGESIGLSQPAMSAALGRLRRHFGDDLLVRDGQRYVLTPLAASLLDQTDVALRYVESTFAARPVFTAATSEREFTVVMSDYAVSVLGGPLLTLLEQQAPRVRLRIRPTDRPTVDEASSSLRGTDLMVLPRRFHLRPPSGRPLPGPMGCDVRRRQSPDRRHFDHRRPRSAALDRQLRRAHSVHPGR